MDHNDDDNRLVFGKLDSEPIAMTDMYLGEELAVSYDNIRDSVVSNSPARGFLWNPCTPPLTQLSSTPLCLSMLK